MNRKEVAKKIYDHKVHIDEIWKRISEQNTMNANFGGDLNAEHNRISVLAPKVDMLVVENMKLRQDIADTKDLAERLMAILQRSGILEEAVEGNDLFQMQSTVDMLRRYPLYRINKVVTK